MSTALEDAQGALRQQRDVFAQGQANIKFQEAQRKLARKLAREQLAKEPKIVRVAARHDRTRRDLHQARCRLSKTSVAIKNLKRKLAEAEVSLEHDTVLAARLARRNEQITTLVTSIEDRRVLELLAAAEQG